MQAVALIAGLLSLGAPSWAQSCSADDGCPYKCARDYGDGRRYCSACCVALEGEDRHETEPLVFFERPRLAAVGRHSVSIYELPAGSSVTVAGRSADAPIAASGTVAMPDVAPKRVLTFSEPLAWPKRPQRNGERFLACTDSRGPKRPAKAKEARSRFCGVLDLKGDAVYAAPAPAAGGWVEALALSEDGTQAAFEYGRKKAVDSYVIWSESVGSKRYKADPKDVKLRRALERLGVNEDFPE